MSTKILFTMTCLTKRQFISKCPIHVLSFVFLFDSLFFFQSGSSFIDFNQPTELQRFIDQGILNKFGKDEDSDEAKRAEEETGKQRGRYEGSSRREGIPSGQGLLWPSTERRA